MRPPSLQKPYDFVSVFDPAIAAPDDKAIPADVEAFRAALVRARDSGDYAPVLKADAQPVKFVLGHISETAFSAVMDEKYGDNKLNQVLFRLAVVSIVGARDEAGNAVSVGKRRRFELSDVADDTIAPAELINDLGAPYRGHIREIAGYVAAKALAPSPHL